MFFPNLMHIKNTDLVLEIGPGAYPFWRSDCLADVFDETSDIDIKQFGGALMKTKGKPLFKIVNGILPFRDNSFDYIICSHVFEHVPQDELPKLASEIMRVASRAYIEFPRPLYDYIYNFNVHLNFMDIVSGKIICLDKGKSRISVLNNFHDYAMDLRKRDLFSIDQYFPEIVAVGMEFKGSIPLQIIQSEDEFWQVIKNNNYFNNPPNLFWKIKNKILPKRILNSIIGEKDRNYFSGKLKVNG